MLLYAPAGTAAYNPRVPWARADGNTPHLRWRISMPRRSRSALRFRQGDGEATPRQDAWAAITLDGREKSIWPVYRCASCESGGRPHGLSGIVDPVDHDSGLARFAELPVIKATADPENRMRTKSHSGSFALRGRGRPTRPGLHGLLCQGGQLRGRVKQRAVSRPRRTIAESASIFNTRAGLAATGGIRPGKGLQADAPALGTSSRGR